MNLVAIFQGFEGRINRMTWWVAALAISALLLGLQYLADYSVGPGAPTTSQQLSLLLNPTEQLRQARIGSWVTIALTAIFIYPALAITAKRLNDRNRPGWVKWLVITPFVAGPLLGVTPLGWEVGDVGNGVMMARPTFLASAIGLAASIAALWMLVECGFLPSAKGIEDMKKNRDVLNDRAALKERRSRAVLIDEPAQAQPTGK